MKQFKENVRTYKKLIKEKKKQIDVLLQQQEQYRTKMKDKKKTTKNNLIMYTKCKISTKTKRKKD